ncbi:uncharacterized protein LOC142586162 [Dermacentor variabilis]|uniref:uncharacterized protein LOC142586162 n=1 Tax=Dermacentor variabilis TaxID=34621 RepID=UPI003F5C9975
MLEQSIFGQSLDKGKLQVPRDLPLPNTALSAHCVFIGDEAFQRKTDFFRPYPGRGLQASKKKFTYRLSRARRRVENAFLILVTRWRTLERLIGEGPENAKQVAKSLRLLHNFQMQVAHTSTHNFSLVARYVRDIYLQYFNSVAGRSSWQDAVV